MKKIIKNPHLHFFRFLAIVILTFSFLFIAPKANAQQFPANLCYAHGAAYKFYWNGDICWDIMLNFCSMGGKGAALKMISYIKNLHQVVSAGASLELDVMTPLTALLICKPLAEDCIVPALKTIKAQCAYRSDFYGPNVTVLSSWVNRDLPGLYYDDENKTLTARVLNNGSGYIWDVDVTVSYGSTDKRDKIVSGGGTLINETIPEMTFMGARQTGTKTTVEGITDSLISQSNLTRWLNKYKSDHDLIPFFWEKTIPFTAPEGKYTKVIINADPSNLRLETSKLDNTYVLEIDKLPTPVSLSVENPTYKRTNPTSLTEYMVSFILKNSGEESGMAHIKWYEGNYESGKNPIHEQNMVIPQLNQVSFDHILNVDVTKGGDSCHRSQKYTLVVFDDEGFIKTRHEFNIPLFAGSISGRVEDLFGKKVVGATVTTSTGQSASVDEYGYYHIGGIPTLGKVTVTATHPEFSKVETKEVEIKFDESFDKCHIEGLTHSGINFVLKDQEVMFTVTLKDTSGKLVNGHVLATNKVSDDKEISDKNFRLDKDINGTGELGNLQPGEYMFTISAGNYKTMAQTVSAVPNNQNLEFILEPIQGRSNDGSLVIQPPQLLWQMDRGVEILSQVTATKDGKRVILYTSRNKPGTGKLYFLDAITGNQVKVVTTLATGGQSQACLGTSYDGNTTALLVHNGTAGIAKDTKNSLILFNNQGSEFAKNDNHSGGGLSDCSVSPDGFYIYPGFLINKSLYAYSRLETKGIGGYSHTSYSSLGPLYFLHGNGLIASCKDGDDQCAQYVSEKEITRYIGLKGPIRVVDSSFNDVSVIFGGFDKLFYYRSGTKTFEKDVNARGREPSASVSMGGQYIIYSHQEPKVHNADFKIITANDIEKTPAYNKDVNENVLFVHANDKGLFYLAEKGRTLKYYQVGKYTTDYNPQTPPTPTPLLTTTGLSFYQDGSFHSAGEKNFNNLESGVIYLANRNLTLNMTDPFGSLKILEGTLFSVDENHHPILLKGQMTADFSSPAIIYAIKFDRFDMSLFQTKLNQFRSGTLPNSEFFVVKNIHTKFTLKNYPNTFNVAVDNGQVSVLADKTEKVVNSGKQVSIDASNSIKESIYIGSKIYAIIIGVLTFVFGLVLFIYRKTKVGGKIISVLKKIGQWSLKVIKIVVIWAWKMAKKIMPILGKAVKKLLKKKD